MPSALRPSGRTRISSTGNESELAFDPLSVPEVNMRMICSPAVTTSSCLCRELSAVNLELEAGDRMTRKRNCRWVHRQRPLEQRRQPMRSVPVPVLPRPTGSHSTRTSLPFTRCDRQFLRQQTAQPHRANAWLPPPPPPPLRLPHLPLHLLSQTQCWLRLLLRLRRPLLKSRIRTTTII